MRRLAIILSHTSATFTANKNGRFAMSRLKKKKQDKSKAVESVIDPTLKIAHNVKKGDVVVLKEVPVRITRTKLSRRRKKYRKVNICTRS